MVGREDKKSNDLFFTCSLIEYISRKTNNTPRCTVNSLGKSNISKIYELADVYHSDNIDDVSDEFINKCSITKGTFDNISTAMYRIPSHWDIGKVYKRLILTVAKADNIDVIDALFKVFNSPISDKIENYNSDMYYQSNQTIYEFYVDM